MPEISEVRTFVDQLAQKYAGQSLLDVKVIGGRFLKKPIDALSCVCFPLHNARFDAKGKFIYWTFDDPTVPEEEGGKTYFFITLGMSASFGEQNKHSAVKFTFSNGEVFFNDIRHFGTIKVGLSPYELERKLNVLGWDCLSDPNMPYDNQKFFEFYQSFMKKKDKTLAEILLDQSLFCGCGNYLKNDLCYISKINPTRMKNSISRDELHLLCRNLVILAKEAYGNGGATISTYKDMKGQEGGYQFKVYRKKNDNYGNVVSRIISPDGRSTYLVSNVQI